MPAKLVRCKYLMWLYRDEYVAHESVALSEKLVFRLHQYFVLQVDLAWNVLNHFVLPRTQHAVHQSPWERQSVELCLLQCQLPTPLVLSIKSKQVDLLQQLQMHFLNVHTLQRRCNQLPCQLYLDIVKVHRKIRRHTRRGQRVLNQLRQQ